jgi:hypothetical protein
MNLALALLALAAIVGFVVARRSRKEPGPGASVPPRKQARPATAPPIARPDLVVARPARPEFEWRWGGKVGPAEELDVVGPGFRHRFLRYWGEWNPGEMQAVGEAARPDSLDDLVARVVPEGAISGSFDAWMKPVTDDPYDPGGVEVVAIVRPDLIEKVASLSRDDAAKWHARLRELERRTGRGFLVHGRVLKSGAAGSPHSVLVLAEVETLEEVRVALDALPAPDRGPRRIRRRTDADL